MRSIIQNFDIIQIYKQGKRTRSCREGEDVFKNTCKPSSLVMPSGGKRAKEIEEEELVIMGRVLTTNYLLVGKKQNTS